MGVAVAAALDAAKAGATLGPRAKVNAVSKASIFLGAVDALSAFNIFSSVLRPTVTGANKKMEWPRNCKSRSAACQGSDAPVKAE